MATKMANIDLTPLPGTSAHVHVPSGLSSAHANNPSDFPNAAPSASNSQGKAINTKINSTQGQTVRFANPS